METSGSENSGGSTRAVPIGGQPHRRIGGESMKTINLVLLLASGLGVAATPPKSGAACPIERTIYRQPGNPGTTAGFARQGLMTAYASKLVFWVKGAGQTFWFGFNAPNGYGGTYLYQRIAPSAVKPAPEGETPVDTLEQGDGDEAIDPIEFDAFDAQLMAFQGPPQLGDRAPAYLFARGLGPLFHYAHNGNAYIKLAPNTGVQIDIAFWRPAGCRPA